MTRTPLAFSPVLSTDSNLLNCFEQQDKFSIISDHAAFHEKYNTLILSVQEQPLQQSPTFEAVAPDTSILIGFVFVVILSVIASVVWANEVVPVSRTKLALSKRDGEVKKYLAELKNGASSKTSLDNTTEIESSSFAQDDLLQNVDGVTERESDGRDFERWLFTDWLENNKSEGKPGRKKEPALPILKSAKWNSGDNPVVVTAAIMMVGVIIASVTERVGGSL
mmetsp:Transcript_3744/g.4912  ORF Transcript_3744/g.4912 Transcript_3744/m.4912 type:complete len:223 (-) Transcript_3744:330-998(-)